MGGARPADAVDSGDRVVHRANAGIRALIAMVSSPVPAGWGGPISRFCQSLPNVVRADH